MAKNHHSSHYKGKYSRKKSRAKPLRVLLCAMAVLAGIYWLVACSSVPIIAQLRTAYISTAMSTMRHQWLATALLPDSVVQEAVAQMDEDRNAQMELQSAWEDVSFTSARFPKERAAAILSGLNTQETIPAEALGFFNLFHELDEESTWAYAQAHPEVIADGWDNFYVNEAGLDDSGTEIYTKQGDQVLAVNAEHGLLVIRVTGTGYRGLLVIAKDAGRLKLAPSSSLGSYGQHIGDIAEANDGIVAMTGSGFADLGGANGVGEGGDMTGAAMHSGKIYGQHYPWGYKRIELHTDNRLYITDAQNNFSPDCTDACEFSPALIVDGQIVVDEGTLYSALNPRCVLGQTRDESIMMLCIEGRLLDSLGTDAVECAEIMARYDCYQAMNVDGGTSAIIWYEGEYITRCSNTALPEGRHLPNAWIYCRETVPDP